MNRLNLERSYWNNNALDPDVDTKYICDINTDDCLDELGRFNGKILEIGCGVGRLMQTGYYGIDISENMLEIAKQRKPDCYYKLTDGRTIPYPDNSFDFIYSFLVFQHLTRVGVKSYINEAYRCLRSSGILRFQFIEGNENEPFSKHYEWDELQMMLIVAGYKVTYASMSELHPQWKWATAIK